MNSYDPTFIPDGYILTRVVKAVPRLHGRVSFSFRPTTADQRDEIRRKIRDSKPGEYNSLIRNMLAAHVKEWDVKGPDGTATIISAATIKNLQPQLYDKMFFMAIGDMPGDIEDDAGPEEEGGYLQQLEAAAGEGQQAVAQKN